MTNIGVITRGKYGKRLISTLLMHTDLKVFSAEVPEHLPEFIDEPEEFLEQMAMDRTVFNADIVVTYSLHPDLTPQIAHMAGKAGVGALIVPGGASKAPVKELEQISKEYGMYIEVDDICCNLSSNPAISKFTDRLSSPLLEITIHEGKVEQVNIIRGAPCGSTWHMAEGLKGVSLKDAPAKAGLLIQQYPCRAVRGNKGGIHESAKLHKDAVSKAIEQAILKKEH
ncbi:DUF166 domain-containing protein [uncultured Methanomethylovorans sp.]|uniref:DUF166 domain-containing protein n=1 Tax=uncultured Methanomethylovorans sp. TaxID=183759 RepID=UPI002AA92F9A|nr:DUF166 domain-containing protein [uncultured Methanomethylovorans sp.]